MMSKLNFQIFRQRTGNRLVAIRAVQFTYDNGGDLIDELSAVRGDADGCYLSLDTPDTVAYITHGDWVIAGVVGYYAYGPSEFARLFELVES